MATRPTGPTTAGAADGSSPARGFRPAYGAGPWHLLVTTLALALAAYTLGVLGPSALWDPEVWWQSIAVWFLGAVIAHDLVLFPVYAAADRALARTARVSRRVAADRRRVSVLNHLRVPLLAVGLTFVLFFPGILEQGSGSYADATGQTQEPFLRRWLLLSAAIFAVSAAVYGLRLLRSRRDGEPACSVDRDADRRPGG